MEHSPTTATSSGFTESVSRIEFDVESRSFRATYDSARDSTSLAIVSVVATALGRETLDLNPIQSVVETDALDRLVAGSAPGLGNCDSVSFAYEGLDVTVTSEGVIEATPMESA